MFEKVKSMFGVKEAPRSNEFEIMEKGFGLVSHAGQDYGGYYGMPTRTPGRWLQLKNTNPRMSPIEKMSNDIASVRWKHIVDGQEWEDSPAIELLSNPNMIPGFSGFMNFKISQQYSEILGEWFWLIRERDSKGRPSELMVVPPTWVTKVATNKDDYYTVNSMNGQVYTVPYDDMIYFKNPNIVNPYRRGIGQVQAIGDEVETDEQMSKFSKQVFSNGAMPPMAIGIKTGQQGNAAKETLERAKQSWMRTYSGIKNAFVPAFFNGESMDVKVLRQTMQELDYLNSRKGIRDMTLEYFGIPKELMGIVENSNRSTITQAQTIYAKNVLVPRLGQIETVLNNQYLVQFGLPGYIEYEEVVPEDREFISEQASKDWDSGLITKNEARVAKGYDETTDGNVYKQNISTILVRQVQAEPEIVEEDDTILEIEFEESKSVHKYHTQEAREQIWKSFDDAAEAGEQNFIRDLKKYFQSQQNELSRVISKNYKVDTITKADIEDEVEDFFKEEDAVLLSVMLPHLTDSAKRGYAVANEAFDLGVSWDVVRDPFALGVQEWGLDRAKLINDTTKQALRDTIADGIMENESIPQIRDRVSSVYDDAKNRRATVIARTETHNSTVNGSFITYEQAGVQQKEWLVTQDGKERDWHGSMAGQIQNINDPFITGQGNELMFPGDPMSTEASEVVSCRCALLAVVQV